MEQFSRTIGDVILFLNSSLSSCVLLTEKQARAGNSGAPSLIALWCTLSCLDEWVRFACFPEAKLDGADCAVLYACPLSLSWMTCQAEAFLPPLFLGMYLGVPQLKHSSYQKLEYICLRGVYYQLRGGKAVFKTIYTSWNNACFKIKTRLFREILLKSEW